MEKFKIGDIIDYSFFNGVRVVGSTENEYVLQDKAGNQKNIYKHLVDKYGKLVQRYDIEKGE